MKHQRRLHALPPDATFVTTLNGSECGHELRRKSSAVADFGSGCGQNLQGSTAARTHGMSQCMNCC